MDQIHIEQLEVEALIGVYDWEKTARQRLWVDITLYTDISLPAKTDDLANALDYAEIAKQVQQFSLQNRRQLLEGYIEDLAALLLGIAGCEQVTLTVHKPQAIAEAKNTRLTVTRKKQ